MTSEVKVVTEIKRYKAGLVLVDFTRLVFVVFHVSLNHSTLTDWDIPFEVLFLGSFTSQIP